MTPLALARRPLALALTLTLAAPAVASTFVVDDDGGPGVDFTDLPAAVAASSHGDVILVHPGSYSDFVLSKGVTILGTAPGVVVAPGSRVSSLPAPRRAVLARMELRDLRIVGCAGTVVLDEVELPHPAQSPLQQLLLVQGSPDVRVFGSTVDVSPGGDSGEVGARVALSRLELVQSTVRGDAGLDVDCGTGGPGGDGLALSDGARAHVVATDVLGGEGGANTYPCVAICNQGAGDGGAGLVASGAGTTVILAGPFDRHVQGGFEGNGGECPCDGEAGDGLVVGSGAAAFYSGVSILPGGNFCGGSFAQAIRLLGGTATPVSPPDPYLTRTNVPAPGAPVRFTVYGQPGDAVTLKLGRFPVVQPLPGVAIERLTTEERSMNLGTIGAAGNVTLQLVVPASLPQGFTFHAQAVVQRGSEELRTNSVPVVLR